MYAILKALENSHDKLLCFASKEDSERFKDFANTYMEESGAGNGYGAYWVYFDAQIVEVSEILKDVFSCKLDRGLISSMLEDIVCARTAGESGAENIYINIGFKNYAITFFVGELPERQSPQAGDMFRSLQTKGVAKIEGRVLKIDDGKVVLSIVSSQDEIAYREEIITLKNDKQAPSFQNMTQ
jgi:hypothetical protein